MITYNLAPIPFWTFNDHDTGTALIGGYMFTYEDTDRGVIKPVYSEPSGTIAYSQPIYFDTAGSAGPFYWASDSNYYLEIFNAAGTLQYTMPAYNAGGGGSGPITENINLLNYILDSQFRYAPQATISPVTVSQTISNGFWYFTKGNTSATDAINFIDFGLGDVTPPNNPRNFFRYQCTVPGSGESFKYLESRIPKVRNFQGETISISFWGQSSTTENRVAVFIKQNFGSGGTPSPDVLTPVGTFTLPALWGQVQQNAIVVPSIGGKSLGTDGSDYVSLVFSFFVDAITTIDLVNISLNEGVNALPLQYLDDQQTANNILPYWNSKTQRSQFLGINSAGFMQWIQDIASAYIPIGGMIMWTASAIPAGFVVANGQPLLTASYPALFALWGYFYGGSGGTFNVPNLNDAFVRNIGISHSLNQLELSAFETHVHQPGAGTTNYVNITSTGTTGFSNTGTVTAFFPATTGSPATGNTDIETRPINRAFPFIIRAL